MFLIFKTSNSASSDLFLFFILCLYCLHLSLLSTLVLPGEEVVESRSRSIEEDIEEDGDEGALLMGACSIVPVSGSKFRIIVSANSVAVIAGSV